VTEAAGRKPTAAYERDSGLAAERTELAWGRSALALLACGAATVKGLPKVTGTAAHPLAGAVILGLGGLVWLLGLPYARARAKAAHDGLRHRVTAWELAPVALGTALVGVAGLVINLFLPT
jgi:uncharacterized membrane protein YidH (DUF202 family)